MKLQNKKIKSLLPVFVVVFFVLFLPGCKAAQKDTGAEAGSAHEIHYNTIVIDTHNDSLLNVVEAESLLPYFDIGQRVLMSQLDLPKMRDGGLDVAFFGAWTDDDINKNVPGNTILCLLNALYWLEEKNQESFGIAKTPKEMRDLYDSGKLAGVPAIEGGYSIKAHNYKELLAQYKDLGVAYISLCWSTSNDIGEGVYECYVDATPSSGGLTALGASVVREMNRLGIAVDVSHLNDATFWGVVEASSVPIIASHSNAWGVYKHMRNLKDDQMLAIAKSGGVVHQNFFSGYLGPPGQQGLENLIDMIDYTVKLIGIDHVGLGSDFDGGPMPFDLPNAMHYHKITAELVERGYTRENIEKILGKNTLRVMQAIQDAAEAPVVGGEPLVITPDIVMGGMLKSRKPRLAAKVEGNQIDAARFRIIVDGIAHVPAYDSGNGLLSVTLREPLPEKFHVVTFEGANTSGHITRETKIFYIDDEPSE